MQRGLLFLHLGEVAGVSLKPIFKPQDSSKILKISYRIGLWNDPTSSFCFAFFLMDFLDLRSWAGG